MPMQDLYSAPSKYLELKYSNESDEFLILGPIFLNLDFRYKMLKYQFQIHTQRLQNHYV